MTTKRNADCVIVDHLPFEAPAGHTVYRRGSDGAVIGLQFGCPCGCGVAYGASFVPPHGWKLTGTHEKPTVEPSLGCYPSSGNGTSDGTFHWHGYLRAGIFEEC